MWTETVETVVLEIISGQRRGKRVAIARFILFLFSKVYGLAIKIRRVLYDFRILRDSTLGVQVIPLATSASAAPARHPWWKNLRAN